MAIGLAILRLETFHPPVSDAQRGVGIGIEMLFRFHLHLAFHVDTLQASVVVGEADNVVIDFVAVEPIKALVHLQSGVLGQFLGIIGFETVQQGIHFCLVGEH